MMEPTVKAWRCALCGYVHRGEAPPERCPVCGAPASDFESFDESPASAPAAPAKRWRCLLCGYEHEGASPPDSCPLCGATRDQFEPVGGSVEPIVGTGPAAHLVVIGGGVAAVAAAESIRNTSPEAAITLVSKEPDLPYYRLNLTRLLAGEIDEAPLPIHPAAWYGERAIRLVTGSEVVRLSLAPKEIELAGGERIGFDKAVLATGAHALVPPVPGADRAGVFRVRTIEDVRGLLAIATKGRRCVCIGGGILGLETAGALVRRGVDVTLLEGHSYLMPRQLPARGGEVMKAFVAGLGIRLRTQARTSEILGGDGVSGVKLEDGSIVPADVVVLATGVRPNSYLAREAGLGVKTGVVVDRLLRTSHPDVYAAGDVCEHEGILYGSWAAAQFQGSIAGMNAAGLSVEFGGLPRSHTLKVLGLGLTSIGKFEAEDGGDRVVEEANGAQYRRFVFRDGCLVGAILMGDTHLAAAASKAIEKRAAFPGLRRDNLSVADVSATLNG